MTAIWDLEAVVLREKSKLPVAAGLLQRNGDLLVVYVADTLEEQQREDICLEISSIHRPAKDIRGLPVVCFQRRQTECGSHGVVEDRTIVRFGLWTEGECSVGFRASPRGAD